MPDTDKKVKWWNRNPGVVGAVVSIVFVAPAYGLWYHENNQTNEAVECIVNSLSERDAASDKNRDVLVTFFDEFSAFLRGISQQTSAKPLLESSDKAEESLRKVTITINANDLKKCLGE